jgi:hypothetical protein
VFVALLLFFAGCSGAQPTQAEPTIPEIIGITIVIDGQKQAINEGKLYQLGNRQYFDLQVSDNVTEVEFLFVPDYADQSQALLSRGTKIADGVYSVEGDYFLSGQGYFLVYNHNIAVRSGRFSLSAPSC